MKFLDIRASPYITRALSLTNEVPIDIRAGRHITGALSLTNEDPFDISAGGFILSVGSEWGLDFRTN